MPTRVRRPRKNSSSYAPRSSSPCSASRESWRAANARPHAGHASPVLLHLIHRRERPPRHRVQSNGRRRIGNESRVAGRAVDPRRRRDRVVGHEDREHVRKAHAGAGDVGEPPDRDRLHARDAGDIDDRERDRLDALGGQTPSDPDGRLPRRRALHDHRGSFQRASGVPIPSSFGASIDAHRFGDVFDGKTDRRHEDPLRRVRAPRADPQQDLAQLRHAFPRHEALLQGTREGSRRMTRLVFPDVAHENVGPDDQVEHRVQRADRHEDRALRDPRQRHEGLRRHRRRHDDRDIEARLLGALDGQHRHTLSDLAFAERSRALRIDVPDTNLLQVEHATERHQLGPRLHAGTQYRRDLRAGVRQRAHRDAGDGAGTHRRDDRSVEHREREPRRPIREHDEPDPPWQTSRGVVGDRRDPLQAGDVEVAPHVRGHRHDAALALLRTGVVPPEDRDLPGKHGVSLPVQTQGVFDDLDRLGHVEAPGSHDVLL